MLATLTMVESLFLPPVCLAIALVTSAAHRDEPRVILRHALRTALALIGGILLFKVGLSYFLEWVLPR